MKKIIGYFLIFIFVLGFIFSSQNPVAAAMESMQSKKNMPAPDFSLPTAKGNTVSLKDLKGKGVILFFFTSWCPYCRKKFPFLAKESEKFRQEGVELLVIDAGESKEKVLSVIEKDKLPFDILLDAQTEVSSAYDVVGVPTFVLISPEGIIVYDGNDLPSNYKELISSKQCPVK